MGLLSVFSRKKDDSKPKRRTNAEIEADFQEWSQNVTVPEVRDLFLESLLQGHESSMAVVNAEQVAHFDSIVSTLASEEAKEPQSESKQEAELSASAVIAYAAQVHTGAKSAAITAAASLLETLLTSHAHFPFTAPTPLTRDALLRAICQLTWDCEDYFKQNVGLGSDDLIRKRPEKARLQFMYSAFGEPPVGGPSQHDVVDVLCRVKYPMGFFAKPKNEPRRRAVQDLQPLAARLQPLELATPDAIPVATLQPLVQLAQAFPLRFCDPVQDVGYGDVETMTMGADQFVRWAKRVQFLDVLHQVFEVFFEETKDSRSSS